MTAVIAVFSSLHAMLIAVLIAAALPSASSSCGFESMNKLCGKSCEPKEWCEMYNGASSECERAYIRAVDTNRGESVGIYRCVYDDAAATCAMTVRLANLDGGDAAAVVLGATPNPVLPGNGSGVCYPTLASAVPYGNATCAGFELLCSTPEVPHEPSNPSAWVPASATVSADGMALTLTAKAGTGVAGLVARGSRYAWADFPQATLFAAAPGGGLGLPVLPWNQALVCSGASPLPAGAVC